MSEFSFSLSANEVIREKDIDAHSKYNRNVLNELKNGQTKKCHFFEYLRIIQPLNVNININGQFDSKELDDKILETIERVHKAAR